MKKFLILVFIGAAALLLMSFLYSHTKDTGQDSPGAGKVTAIFGNVTIVRAGGVEIYAVPGSAVYPDDEIQTSPGAAVNITFADNSSFALGEDARLSVKQFTYDRSGHSGRSFFSIAQGMFVYVSGLIGKDNPDRVNIETSVGSIGIRGTVIVGDIRRAGESSKMTVVDGAIAITNGGGTLELKGKLQTASIKNYVTVAANVGKISPQAFVQQYQSVAVVAEDTFGAFDQGWYVGGTLQKATVAEWQRGLPEDQMATSADFMAATRGIADIVMIKDKDKAVFKKQVIGLRECMNQLIGRGDADPDKPVAELVVMCVSH